MGNRLIHRNASYYMTIISLLLGSVHGFAREVIRNGGFEMQIEDWITFCSTTTVGRELIYGGYSNNTVAHVTDESCIRQDVCVVEGGAYFFRMKASRNTHADAPGQMIASLRIEGLDNGNNIVSILINLDFSRSNAVFNLTPLDDVGFFRLPVNLGIVRLRISVADNTPGNSAYGMVIDDVSLERMDESAIAFPDNYPVDPFCITEIWSPRTVPVLDFPGIRNEWHFGQDALPETAIGTQPDVIWTVPGQKEVLCVQRNEVCIFDTVRAFIMVEALEISLGTDTALCSGDLPVVLSRTDGTWFPPESRYRWSTGDTTPAIRINDAGIYWLQLVYRGCAGLDSIAVTVETPPEIRMLSADTVLCGDIPIVLVAWQSQDAIITWSDGSRGERLETMESGIYIATATNQCGVASDSVMVQRLHCDIKLPNVFTPNGDGNNDIFRILGSAGNLDQLYFFIFDRWGKKIFHTQDWQQGWDGTDHGRPAEDGTYAYMLEYNSKGRPFRQQGSFHLIR